MSQSSGHVTHVLLTRSRLCPRASPGSSHHLHVLSTPPAFVLSQDQTLRERLACHPAGPKASRLHCLVIERCRVRTSPATRVHNAAASNSTGLASAPRSKARGRTWTRLRTPHAGCSRSHMLLSFQRPTRPQDGDSVPNNAPRTKKASRREAHLEKVISVWGGPRSIALDGPSANLAAKPLEPALAHP